MSEAQKEQMEALGPLYKEWNAKINVVSRKDIDELYERHVLHSLSIAKLIQFNPGARILDVGTGGGFPGIPLAILFPETEFYLVDSIGKKIKVCAEISSSIGLQNLKVEHVRMEKVKGQFDFIVSRAVAQTRQLYQWTRHLLSNESNHDITNGWILLKGGDLANELAEVHMDHQQFPIAEYFEQPFFETKHLVYMRLKRP